MLVTEYQTEKLCTCGLPMRIVYRDDGLRLPDVRLTIHCTQEPVSDKITKNWLKLLPLRVRCTQCNRVHQARTFKRLED